MDFRKTQKVKKVNPRTMIVAMDIGKGFHVGYFRAPNGEMQKAFLFSNSAKNFNEFWGRVEEEACKAGSGESFSYTKRVKELTGNSPNKTDHKDPRVRSRSVQMSGKNALLFSPVMIKSLRKE